MASKGIELGFLLVLVMVHYYGAAAQSGCLRTLMNLSPCLNYVTGKSSPPSSSCCSQLAIVVQSQPRCLCTLVNGGGPSLGISINQTLALSLPGACNVQTPPTSRCSAANSGPAASPVSSPESAPADSLNETPDSPTATGSLPSIPAEAKTVITTGGSAAGASISRMQLQLTVFIVFIALFGSDIVRF